MESLARSLQNHFSLASADCFSIYLEEELHPFVSMICLSKKLEEIYHQLESRQWIDAYSLF